MATDFGTDIAAIDDLPANFHTVKGLENVAYALLRRLFTERGWLFERFGGDPDYGFNVLGKLNADLTFGELAALRAEIEDELLKDERVDSVVVGVEYTRATQEVEISIDVQTQAGPFSLVVSVDGLDVTALFNGEAISVPTIAAPVTTVTVGPQGPAGPPGPAGAPGGGSSTSLVEVEVDGEFFSTTGTEELVADEPRDLSGLGGSLVAQLLADVRSAAGVATFRLRVGGTIGAADGTVVATITRDAAGGTSFVGMNATGSPANPGGLQRVKISIQSSGAGVEAGIKGAEASLRG